MFISQDPIKDGRNWFAYCGNNPINAIDPDGRIFRYIGVIRSNSLTREEARQWINDYVLTRDDRPITVEMYTKGMDGDSSPYIRGIDSPIAKAMSKDSGAYANRTIVARLAAGITSSGDDEGLTNWTNPDLRYSIGACRFTWSLKSYDPNTKIAIVTVKIVDEFDFNPGNRGFPGENLTTIGRTAGLAEYHVEVTYQLKVKVDIPDKKDEERK